MHTHTHTLVGGGSLLPPGAHGPWVGTHAGGPIRRPRYIYRHWPPHRPGFTTAMGDIKPRQLDFPTGARAQGRQGRLPLDNKIPRARGEGGIGVFTNSDFCRVREAPSPAPGWVPSSFGLGWSPLGLLAGWVVGAALRDLPAETWLRGAHTHTPLHTLTHATHRLGSWALLGAPGPSYCRRQGQCA